MADVPTENFLRPVVLEADYQQLARYAEVFERIFSVDGELTVRTKAGTNATMTMRGHVPLSISSCRSHHKGDHDYLPGGAWFGCPIDESVTGTFVIDSSMEPGVAGGILTEPVVLTFRDGVLVDIDGGAQARELEAWLDSCDDQIRGAAHAGGGGCGNPLDRDPAAVVADVRDGYVSRECAEKVYGLIVAPDGTATTTPPRLARQEARTS